VEANVLALIHMKLGCRVGVGKAMHKKQEEVNVVLRGSGG
jgi:hypothetical protein